MKLQSTIVSCSNDRQISFSFPVPLESIHKYVPAISEERSIVMFDGTVLKYTETNMWQILFGGDQLTVACARCAIDIRFTHDSEADRLHGVIPVLEDWHARMIKLVHLHVPEFDY